MVIGLDVWQAHFKDFPDRYVLVGGVACDLLMVDAGLPFRATKDLDVVLLVEVLDAAAATSAGRRGRGAISTASPSRAPPATRP